MLVKLQCGEICTWKRVKCFKVANLKLTLTLALLYSDSQTVKECISRQIVLNILGTGQVLKSIRKYLKLVMKKHLT